MQGENIKEIPDTNTLHSQIRLNDHVLSISEPSCQPEFRLLHPVCRYKRAVFFRKLFTLS